MSTVLEREAEQAASLDALTLAAGLLARCEARRRSASEAIETTGGRSAKGQFFTPLVTAKLIASMPTLGDVPVRLLDPGAGSGMLSAAFVARWLVEGGSGPVHVVAVERDISLIPALTATLEDCQRTAQDLGAELTVEILNGDFIHMSTGLTACRDLVGGFDLVIENPPYGKLGAGSAARKAVQQMGADAPNLYAAFVALGVAALKPGGQLVAITPRSFCNGPYFETFRKFLLQGLVLDRFHVFEARGKVFSDTGVLQENVIFCGTADGERSEVVISQSVDQTDRPTSRQVRYSDVVEPSDPHQFIRLTPSVEDRGITDLFAGLPCALADLDVAVSTGKIVDFRSRDQLKSAPVSGAVPLIYPGNMRSGVVEWPREIRKAQWFAPDGIQDRVQLVPEGLYVLIKRFSSKEERRRVAAAVWSPENHPGPVAFENHLNVIHHDGAGLDYEICAGLTLWLNSSVVDRYFRTFSGHTQVNATDLRSMRFPSADALRTLGATAVTTQLTQDRIDQLVGEMLDCDLPVAA